MNSIVHVVETNQKPKGDPSDPHYVVPMPVFYRQDSFSQLANNDTRRYVKGDITYNIKLD